MSKTKQQNRTRSEVREPHDTHAAASGSLSNGRKWLFRLTASLLIPLAALTCLELGLRVAGFGYPTAFFLKSQIKGKSVLIGNGQFGMRFFPQEMARIPSPLVMSAEKPADVCRIFVLGESAALGDPEPAFGFGRYLQVLLEERYPQKKFEVICTAMTAINSHAIVPIARECARHQGDVWIIYMGNNEFVGPFGPSTIFGPQTPPLSLIRLNLAIKSTRVGQLLYRLASRRVDHKSWGGMKMFLDNQVGPADPRKEKVYDYFQKNLEDILAAAGGSGAKVILSTVAANLRDCPPFGSQHPKNMSEDQKTRWQQLYSAAVDAQTTNNYPAAIANYDAAAQIDSTYAELQYRWGQCFLGLTNYSEAKHHFELARDCDSLPFRADSRLNSIIRESLSKHSTDGVSLIDSEKVLAAQSKDGIPGKESMYEHVHLNFDGNYNVGLAMAEDVAKLLPNGAKSGDQQEWATFDQCTQRLALTDWDRRRIYESLLHRLSEPPFVNQMDHASQMEALRNAVLSARARQTSNSLQQAQQIYEKAVSRAPADLYLRGDFAKFDEEVGNLPGAVEQWQRLRDEIPFAPGPHYYLGRDLGRQGKVDEALQELAQALAIRPDLAEALEEKGRVLTQAKRYPEGLAALDRAAELEPGNGRIYLERAEALAASGRRGEALAQLQRAVEVQPGSWEARYLLGVELAFNGSIRPAAEQFIEAVRLNPNYAPGHLNLGIALAKLDKVEEAMQQFQVTLRLDPKNEKAAEYYQALRATQERKQKVKR